MRTIHLSTKQNSKLRSLYRNAADNFNELVHISGLNKRRDFRHKKLTRINFCDANLEDFDFSYSDLSDAEFNNNTTTSETTIFAGAIISEDFQSFLESQLELKRKTEKHSILKEIVVQHGDYRARINALRFYFAETRFSEESQFFFKKTVLKQANNKRYIKQFESVRAEAHRNHSGFTKLLRPVSKDFFDVAAFDALLDEARIDMKSTLTGKASQRPILLRNFYSKFSKLDETPKIALDRLKNDVIPRCREESVKYLLRSNSVWRRTLRDSVWEISQKENSASVNALLFKSLVNSCSSSIEVMDLYRDFASIGESHQRGAISYLSTKSYDMHEVRNFLLQLANSEADPVKASWAREGLLPIQRVHFNERRSASGQSAKSERIAKLVKRRNAIHKFFTSTDFHLENSEEENLVRMRYKIGSDDLDGEIVRSIQNIGLSIGRKAYR